MSCFGLIENEGMERNRTTLAHPGVDRLRRFHDLVARHDTSTTGRPCSPAYCTSALSNASLSPAPSSAEGATTPATAPSFPHKANISGRRTSSGMNGSGIRGNRATSTRSIASHRVSKARNGRCTRTPMSSTSNVIERALRKLAGTTRAANARKSQRKTAEIVAEKPRRGRAGAILWLSGRRKTSASRQRISIASRCIGKEPPRQAGPLGAFAAIAVGGNGATRARMRTRRQAGAPRGRAPPPSRPTTGARIRYWAEDRWGLRGRGTRLTRLHNPQGPYFVTYAGPPDPFAAMVDRAVRPNGPCVAQPPNRPPNG